MSTPKKIGEGYVTAIHRFAEVNGIPVVHFKKGEYDLYDAMRVIEEDFGHPAYLGRAGDPSEMG